MTNVIGGEGAAGAIHREVLFIDGEPWFKVRGEMVPATVAGDVWRPIVTGDEYPRCPDCGGRIAWAEAGGVPGSRVCEGMTEPDLAAAGAAADPPGVSSEPDGCGSRFVDTRYGSCLDEYLDPDDY